MRLASVSGRATLLVAGDERVGLRGVDVGRASEGRFGPDIATLYPVWDSFRAWASRVDTTDGFAFEAVDLGNPAQAPSQVFAIGLNYASHAGESGLAATRDAIPPTFTKFASSLSAPFEPVVLASDKVDWEVELVVVIGRHAESVPAADAWSYVAGLAVGQDYSNRSIQLVGPVPQFSLAKSFPTFGPIGPWLVTPDELDNPDDLEVVCEVNGTQVQNGRTSAMIWPVPDLVSVLSGITPLRPGDVIFTGTPGGVGVARTPPQFLSSGDVVVTRISGIGEIRQECVPGQ